MKESNIPDWANPAKAKEVYELPRKRPPMSPIQRFVGKKVFRYYRYVSAVYVTATNEIYLLEQDHLEDIKKAAQSLLKPAADYEEVLSNGYQQYYKKCRMLDAQINAQNIEKHYAFAQQTATQKKASYEQALAQVQAQLAQAQAQQQEQQQALTDLQQQGPIPHTSASGKTEITTASKEIFQQTLAQQTKALQGLAQQIQTYQTQIQQLQKQILHCAVAGYHQPLILNNAEFTANESLEQSRAAMVEAIKPYVNQEDNLVELMVLVDPKITVFDYKNKPFTRWLYLSKSDFDQIKSKLDGAKLMNIEAERAYAFTDTNGQSAPTSNGADDSGINLSALSGASTQVTTGNPIDPVQFQLVRHVLNQQGAKITREDYQPEFALKFDEAMSTLQQGVAHGQPITKMNTSQQAKLLRYAALLSTRGPAYYPKSAAPADLSSPPAPSQLDVFSGTATVSHTFPNEEGVEIILKNGNEKISLGVFLLSLDVKLFGYAGVSTLLSSHIEVSQNSVTKAITNIIGHAATGEKANLLNGLSASGEAGAFSGIQAGCALTGEIKWAKVHPFAGFKYVIDINDMNTEQPTVEKYWGVKHVTPPKNLQLLTKLSYTINADIGEGFKGAYYIGYDSNKGQFTFQLSAEVCFGAGWKGSFACVIGAEAIMEMIVFLYQQLKITNFNLEQLFGAVLDKEAYDLISKLIVAVVWTGE